MCSAAVLLCVCVCRMRVRVRTCDTTSPSSSVPAVQIPSITCLRRCVQRCAHSSRCLTAVCSTYMTCVAQQYSCVFACVGYAYVFEPAIVLPHLPPAFLRYKSLPSPVYASFPMYADSASPATAVRPVTSVRAFQHVTPYTCVQRNPCAHCYHTMRPSSLNYAVPFTGD